MNSKGLEELNLVHIILLIVTHFTFDSFGLYRKKTMLNIFN